METKMVDITLHIDETLPAAERERFRDKILKLNGVMAADLHEDKPHLMVIEYDPDRINSAKSLETAKQQGVHAELIGL